MEENTENLEDRLGVLLGNLALKKGLITPKQLREALSEQSGDVVAGKEPRLLGDILVERGHLTPIQRDNLLAEQKTNVPTRPAATPSPTPPTAPKSDGGKKAARKNSAALGKYLLTRELGRGGMGVVYEAIDSDLNRKVALKILLISANAEGEEVSDEEERFVREARVSANLHHPHIVGVHEAGRIEDKRYIAMELIEGRQMNEWRKSGSITIRKQVALLRDVALSVHYAHAQGIIHRDLKPQNILVDNRHQPHVTDFGLAKAVRERTSISLTASGMVMGTPAYMSPEQATGKKTVDRRTDIYALGVMLFEILTGRVPFKGDTPIEILMKKVKEDPPAPSSMVRTGAVDPTIETVCLKALARNPRDRYATVEEFAQDLTKWLKGHDVKTTAPRRRPKLPKQAWIGAIGAAAALLAAILLFALWPGEDYSVEMSRASRLTAGGQYEQALAIYDVVLTRSPDHVEAARGKKKIHELMAQRVFDELDGADVHLRNGRFVEAHAVYRSILAQNPGNLRARTGVELTLRKMKEQREELETRAGEGDETARKDLALLKKVIAEDPPAAPAPPSPPAGNPRPAGAREVIFYDAGNPGGSFGVRPISHGMEIWRTESKNGGYYLRLIPAAGNNYGRLAVDVDDLWARETRSLIVELDLLLDESNTWVEVQYDSTDTGVGADGKYKRAGILSSTGTAPVRKVRYFLPDLRFENRLQGGADLRIQSRGALIRRITIRRETLDSNERVPLRSLPLSTRSLKPGLSRELFQGTQFESRLATGIDRRIDYMFLPGTGPGEKLSAFYSARWTGYFVAPRKGRYLFVAESDDGIRLHVDGVTLITNWTTHPKRTDTGRCMLDQGVHRLTLEYFQASGDAALKLQVYGEADGRMQLLSPPPLFHLPGSGALGTTGPAPLFRQLPPLRGHRQGLRALSVSSDGKRAASGDYNGEIRLWDIESGTSLGTLGKHRTMIWRLAFSPDGNRLAACSGTEPERVRLWDVRTRKPVRVYPIAAAADVGQVMSLAYAPDGKTLVYGEASGDVHLVDPDTGREIRFFRPTGPTIRALAYAPDGRTFAAADVKGLITLWSASDAKLLGKFEGHSKGILTLAFTPDGKTLASGAQDRTIRLWDVAGGRPKRTLHDTGGNVEAVAFSPDGKTLAAASPDKFVRAWNWATGKLVWKGPTGVESVTTLAFTPDGRHLVGSGNDWSLKRWEFGTRAPAAAKAPGGEPPRSRAPSKELTVDSITPWTDSGFDVRKGDLITFSAEGQWTQHGGGATVGPLGTNQIARTAVMPLQGVPVMALIGKVGGTGRPFQVRPGTEVEMPAAGRLYLGPNDSECANNKGEMRVGIFPAKVRIPSFDEAADMLWKRIVASSRKLEDKTVPIERTGFEDPAATVLSISTKGLRVERPFGGGTVEVEEKRESIPTRALEALLTLAVPRPGEEERFLAAMAYAALGDFERALRTLDLAREAGYDETEVGGLILRRARDSLKGDRRALSRILRKGKRYAEAAEAASKPAPPPKPRTYPEGPVGRWTFDEAGGSRVEDSSGHDQHGTFQGRVERIAGKFGKGIRLHGDGGHVELPNSSHLDDIQEGEYTISAWFRPEGDPVKGSNDLGSYAIVVKPGHHEALRYEAGGKFGMDHWLEPRACLFAGSPIPAPPGRFYHVAVSVSRKLGMMAVYVDGVAGSPKRWEANRGTREYNDSRWRFGAASPRGDYRWPARGTIDEVLMYARVLTPEEIRMLARP